MSKEKCHVLFGRTMYKIYRLKSLFAHNVYALRFCNIIDKITIVSFKHFIIERLSNKIKSFSKTIKFFLEYLLEHTNFIVLSIVNKYGNGKYKHALYNKVRSAFPRKAS
jgi:hypothetical protein